MIAWIARHLPKRIRLKVCEQFLSAMVEFSPNGMDSTIRECGQNLKLHKQIEGWIHD